MRNSLTASLLACALALVQRPVSGALDGKAVYESACVACHATGVLGAPKFGNAADWAPRIKRGVAALHQSALKGTEKGMPPKGGRDDLADAEIKAAVDYMVAQAGGEPAVAAEKPAKKARDPKEAPKEAKAAPRNGQAKPAAGKSVYEATCAMCHASGVAGAPRFGNAEDWSPRIERGIEALYTSALKGTDKGMPAKGGNADLPDADVKAAVEYMVAQANEAAASAPKAAATSQAAPAANSAPAPAPAKKEPEAAAPAKAASASPPPAQVGAAEVNAFNRLLKPPGKRNLAPPEDGIHDPANDGTHALQAPLQSFELLPRSPAGNRVNWVQALANAKIAPRWDRLDPKAEPVVMDLNIVRKVKGSMPDVVYPHKQHTEWLDCSNCHPALFVPQAGANQISMAAILLGQKCGVCHGKVAFPVSECRLCHSKKKDAPTAAEAPKQ